MSYARPGRTVDGDVDGLPTVLALALVLAVVATLLAAPAAGAAAGIVAVDGNETDGSDGSDGLVEGTVDDVDDATDDVADATDDLEDATDDVQNGTDGLEDVTDGVEDATGDLQNATGEVTDATDDVGVDVGTTLDDEGANASLGVDAGATNASVDATADDDLAVDSDVEAALANGTLGPVGELSVDVEDGALTVEAGLVRGLAATLGVDAAPDGSAGTASTAQDEPGAEPDDERGDAAAASDPGARGGGSPVPVDRETGIALGSLALGAGLVARRATTVAGAAKAVGGASSGGVGGALSAAVDWLRVWGWKLAGLAGYQRFDDTDPLEHETRAAVYEHLRDEPGAFLSEVAEATDVPLSTLRYHLRVLEFENLVTEVEVRGKRRLFPANVDPDALETALADDATAAVLEALAEAPDSVSGLAERLDRDPSTVSHHLQRLDDEGLVERERDGRSVVNRLADGLDADRVASGGRVASGAD